MDRKTILIAADCELRRLPLDATEAFVLSRIDGRLTLEEIGEVVGLDFAKTLHFVEHLLEVGAVKSLTRLRSKAPPRSESRHCVPEAQTEKGSVRIDPRVEAISVRPPKNPSMRLEVRKESRRSIRAMRAVRGPTAAAPPRARAEAEDEACELDETKHAEIAGLDARLGTLDHYALLGVERGAEKRDVKRAYFALAAKYHPDRFFGKKLGKMRAALQRIFIRLTEAHDTLSVNARRREYDATLSPEPQPAPAPRPSRKMKARPTPTPLVAPSRRPAAFGPAKAPSMKPPASAPGEHDRFGRLQATAKMYAAQRRADVFLRAAEDALKDDDVINAANNYRLALQYAEDPFVRRKLEAVDEVARNRRHEKCLLRARAAERSERWDEAAHQFARAHEARPDASAAARAAHAFRRSGGDLQIATKLAEQAVSRDGKNAGYRVTLGEIHLAAGLAARAKVESDLALELAPNDPRAKELAAEIRRRR